MLESKYLKATDAEDWWMEAKRELRSRASLLSDDLFDSALSRWKGLFLTFVFEGTSIEEMLDEWLKFKNTFSCLAN